MISNNTISANTEYLRRLPLTGRHYALVLVLLGATCWTSFGCARESGDSAKVGEGKQDSSVTTAQDTTTQSFRPEVSVAQLKAALDSDEEFFLLDVRTQGEYNDAHVGGTDAQIPFTEIIARQSELPVDKETLIYCICRSGRRSGIATAAMTKLGYTKVYNVVGGLLAWATADYPIER